MRLNEIKAARIKSGVSPQQAAEALGIKPDAYYCRERGAAKFKVTELEALSRITGISICDLVKILADNTDSQ